MSLQPRSHDAAALQEQLTSACKQSCPAHLNHLLRAVAAQGDARAAVHCVDLLTSARIDAASWDALRKLESQRVQRDVYDVAVRVGGRTLAPLRRIHKICKGPRTRQRSDAAKEALPSVLQWLEADAHGRRGAVSNRQIFQGVKRRAQADILRKELGLDMNCARGVVTKLKQKKLIW